MKFKFNWFIRGTFKVRAKVWNIYEKLREAEVELIVDSGSTYTVLPESLLKNLMVKPMRTIRLRLADSKIVEKALGEIGIAIDEYSASATPVVFDEEEVYLLGMVAMEQLGLAPDPLEKKLVPVEALLFSFKHFWSLAYVYLSKSYVLNRMKWECQLKDFNEESKTNS